jgi:hypothetical protein
MNTPIPSQDITVIVRGLVVGQGEADARQHFTQRALESIRAVLPGAQVILSTWKGSNLTGLNYDEVVLSDEPEGLYMLREDGSEKLIAANNQIITTRAALSYVDRPYVLSVRSDVVLEHAGFVSYFVTYNKQPPHDVVGHRIAVLPTYNPRRSFALFLFDVCDWFYFGTVADISDLFEIPLMSHDRHVRRVPEQLPYIKDNLESEQYIWTSFLKKKGYFDGLPSLHYLDERLLKLSEQSYARYTIMVPASRAGVVCLKMPRAGYGARPWLSQGLYTFNEYKQLYNRYVARTLIVVPNPFEVFACYLIPYLRRILAATSPILYKGIVNRIRKLHGSTNILK